LPRSPFTDLIEMTATSENGPSRRFWNARTTVVIGVEADIQPAALNKPDL
jgi:hypothetical protein